MEKTRRLARLIGPTIIAVTISEALNARIWATNIAPVVHFNGSVLFVVGLAIILAHNQWIRAWPVVITLVGWCVLLLGLLRMFAPELYLRGVTSTSATSVAISTLPLGAVGLFLMYKGFFDR